MNKGSLALLLTLVLIFLASQTIVIVRDTEKAILLKLGAFERTIEPGLSFKIPFIDDVMKFEARLRTLDTQPDRVLSEESKPLFVDSFVKYKIVDAETFYTSTNGGQDRVAEDTLQRRVRDKLRNEFGKRTVKEVVSGERDELMDIMLTSLNDSVADLGVEIIDFRVKRIDLPPNLSSSVYERMRTERNRLAEELRSEGKEIAAEIRATADRDRTVILADANKESQQIKGSGDAEAAGIYAASYSQDPEFYEFTRSMKAYVETFESKSDVMLIDSDSEFFKYLNDKIEE